MKTRRTLLSILSILFIALQSHAALTIFAAASTTDVMKELAAAFENNGGETVRFNFSSSGALARQLDAGAPAGLYISANVKWMDYIEGKNLLEKETRIDIAQNTLVLIAPQSSTLTFEDFPEKLNGRLAMGEPKSVPAGAYAQAALESLGLFDAVRPHLIKGKDVRTVLLYVARNEVEAGIVYSTDAKSSTKVKILGTFPSESHLPIIYPAACLKDAPTAAKDFLKFLKSDPAKNIFQAHGFSIPSDS
ncbi:MAG: molybdate ABC transporter substrate-binding protein [Pontiella sp.]